MLGRFCVTCSRDAADSKVVAPGVKISEKHGVSLFNQKETLVPAVSTKPAT
jgi:hypothetical protein